MPGQSGKTAIAFGALQSPTPTDNRATSRGKPGRRKTFRILVTDGEPNLDLRGAAAVRRPTGTPAGTAPTSRGGIGLSRSARRSAMADAQA